MILLYFKHCETTNQINFFFLFLIKIIVIVLQFTILVLYYQMSNATFGNNQLLSFLVLVFRFFLIFHYLNCFSILFIFYFFSNLFLFEIPSLYLLVSFELLVLDFLFFQLCQIISCILIFQLIFPNLTTQRYPQLKTLSPHLKSTYFIKPIVIS